MLSVKLELGDFYISRNNYCSKEKVLEHDNQLGRDSGERCW